MNIELSPMFVEKVFSIICFGDFGKYFWSKIKWQWLYLCGFISGFSLSLSFVFMSALGQYCAAFIAMAQYYSLKSGIEIPLALVFLLRIAWTFQGLLCFHMNFRNDFLSL
jgi:hypothetical protein